jgi:hypothetical protein
MLSESKTGGNWRAGHEREQVAKLTSFHVDRSFDERLF